MAGYNFLGDLQASATPEDAEAAIPAWMRGADNHNLGNKGASIFDPSSWGTTFENAGKFMAVSLLSGTNSFYNTGVSVANWFGAEMQANKTDKWIADIDNDLGQYYKQNNEAADLVGFIAGSIIPGALGVKVLNAGQKALAAANAGKVGANMHWSTKLLVPQTESYFGAAASQAAASRATFTKINANTLKMYGAGVQQNVLEATAFEIAAFAALNKAPIFEEMDASDVVKNIATGALLGGAIGGVFTGVKNYYGLQKLSAQEDILARPFSARETPSASLAAADKVILSTIEREAIPVPFLPAGSAPEIVSRHALDVEAYTKAQIKYNNEIRTHLHELTGTNIGAIKGGSGVKARDVEVGNLLADTMHVLPEELLEGKQAAMGLTGVMENFTGAVQVGRVRQAFGIEGEIKDAIKAGLPAPENIKLSYVKLIGDRQGEISLDAPVVLGLADSLLPKTNQSTQQAVMEFVSAQGFKKASIYNPLTETANTVDTAHRIMEARKIWATETIGKLADDADPIAVHRLDIPVIEHMFQTGQWSKLKLVDDGGVGGVTPLSSQELYDHIKEIKQIVADGLQSVHPKMEAEAIARAVNVSLDWLEGTRQLGKEAKDIFWREGINADYTEWKLGRKLISKDALTLNGTVPEQVIRTEFMPEIVKMAHRLPKEFEQINGHVLDGIAYYKGLEKKAQLDANNIVAAHLGADVAQSTAVWTDDHLMQVGRQGAGPGLVSFAAGKYGSPEALAQSLGARASILKQARKEAVQTKLEAPLVNLAQDREAAIGWEVLNRQMALSAEKYVYVSADEAIALGKDSAGLMARKYYKKLQGMVDDVDELDDLKVPLQAGSPEWVAITNEKVDAIVSLHVRENGRRASASVDIAAAHGKTSGIDPNTFYPIRPKPEDYKHVAFVKDDSVVGAGHTSMIHANSPAELQELLNRVPAKYTKITKDQAESYKTAMGEYRFDRSLNENYIDTELKRTGASGRFFPQTDPEKIVNDILNHHLRAEDAVTTDLLRLANRKAYSWLEDQGRAYAELEASRYKGTVKGAQDWEKNPYISYIRTSLDIQQVQDYPLWADLNKKLDSAVSTIYNRIKGYGVPKTDEDITKINQELQKAGYNSAYYDSALNLYANHPAPKGELTKFVRTANAVLARFTLGFDPLNALTNVIGANVLRGTELKQLTRAIQNADPAIAGKLAEISTIQLPGIKDQARMLAPAKLLKNAAAAYWDDIRVGKSALSAQFKAEGWIKNTTDQFRQLTDDFTLQGTESAAALYSKSRAGMTRAADMVEKATGNTHAEDFNRFVSAHVMKQITDLAIEAKVLTPREARSYINTFVARVEGNYLASQRPFIFQGPIGQAIGLFQSYQFNLMQQMFRYVGEGKGKDVAMLLGLQGTFFGLNGLPAFQAINEHIIGTASGNKDNKDIYDAVYGVAGKTAGEFLLYGAPSTLLQANIYSRGDLNPRQWTLIPNSPTQVPIVGAYGKFFNSMYEVAKNSAGGASVWNSFLEGVEHNGLSRPLAGIAQTLRAVSTPNGEVYSTSTKGTVMGTNDLMSWSTAVRIAGGRPMDEAIVNDAVYRIRAYEAVERERKQRLAEVVKLEVSGGQVPDSEQLNTFMERYVELGGKQADFNRYMMDQYKKANTSQAEQIMNQLNNPLGQKLQGLMGGTAP